MPTILAPIIGPLTGLLMLLTHLLQSYGLAIIAFTLLVRMALTPLNLSQARAVRKQAALAPHVRALRTQFKDNLAGLWRAQQALYRAEGIQQGAALRLALVQLPIMLGMLFVFRDLAGPHTAALFHQHFLWFSLDRPDQLFGVFGPLSLLAGLAQWVLQRMAMTPPTDSVQHTVQQITFFLPLLTVIFAVTYPAALALSSLISTLYGIVFQYCTSGCGQLFVSPFGRASVALATGLPTTVNSPATDDKRTRRVRGDGRSPVGHPPTSPHPRPRGQRKNKNR